MGGDRSRLVGCRLPVDDSQQGNDEIDGEDVVCIGEETNAGDHDGSDVILAKWGFVNFCQGKSTTFIRIGIVGIVVIKIVEGSITAGRLLGHRPRTVSGEWGEVLCRRRTSVTESLP